MVALFLAAGGCEEPRARWTDIATGSLHTCALTDDGTVWCWGSNSYGQLGTGDRSGPELCGGRECSSAPVQVEGLPPARAVFAGSGYSCAITLEGHAWCWGSNSYGQLGDGTTESRPAPVPVVGLAGIASMSLAYSVTCAACEDGRAWCWGMNRWGAVGDGSTEDRHVPVPVAGLHDVEEVYTAVIYVYHVFEPGFLSLTKESSCAKTSDSRLWCWGSNAFGNLGDGTHEDRLTPVLRTDIDGVRLFARGQGYRCAQTLDDELWCWGWNFCGLGDGETTDSTELVQVRGMGGATLLATGAMHSCASTPQGAVWCWGENESGQLGDGTSDCRMAPSPVVGLTRLVDRGIKPVKISASAVHTCAVWSDGSARCWGDGYMGQLGRPVDYQEGCPGGNCSTRPVAVTPPPAVSSR